MRKSIVLVFSLVFTVLFVSCTKAQEAPRVPNAKFDLVGTKWEDTYRWDNNDPNSAIVNVVLSFKTSTEVIFVHSVKKGTLDPEEFSTAPIKYSYTYAAPILKVLSVDKTTKTVYKVDEKAGTMFIVAQETLNDGKWVESKDSDYVLLHLVK